LLKPEADFSIDYASYVTHGPGQGSAALDLIVDGMQCAACLWLIEAVLARNPIVIAGRVNMTTHRLRLVWRGSADLAPDLVRSISRLGFRVLPYNPSCLVSS